MNDVFSQAIEGAGIIQHEINGKTYSLKLMPATVGIKVGKKLMKGIGPAFGILLDSGTTSDYDELVGSDFYTQISIGLVRQLDELNIEETIKELLAGCHCDGQPIPFDTHFAGNYGELVALLELSLRENFGDFFTSYLKAKGLEIHTLRQMLPMMKEESQDKSKEK